MRGSWAGLTDRPQVRHTFAHGTTTPTACKTESAQTPQEAAQIARPFRFGESRGEVTLREAGARGKQAS